jgi:type I restriction enzyme S subunit
MAGTNATQTAEIGDVPGHWLVAPLSDFVSRVTYGFTNPMPTTDDGPFMVTAKDVHDGLIDYSTARHTSWEAYRNAITDKSRPRVGDVLLTKDGSIGRVAVCDRSDICINQSVALIQPNDKIHSRFLKFLLEAAHYQSRMEGDSDGTTIKHIYITRVDKMQIAVPPLDEQRAIAHILGTLDDKIELNRRMNETLESMARLLFKSWFVDFDPVRAKAEGRDPGLPNALAEYFPSRLVSSELGDVPEGWGLAHLTNVIDVNPTRQLRRGESAPYLDMANMPTSGHAARDVVSRPFASGTRFINGDTLVARITPCLENGKTAFVDFLQRGEVGWGSTEFIVLRPNQPLPEEYAYCLARSERFREFAIKSMTGTSGRQRVPADSLEHFVVASPPEPIALAFGHAVKPWFARIASAVRESRSLATLRDTLLPKLISGELPIGYAAVFENGTYAERTTT